MWWPIFESTSHSYWGYSRPDKRARYNPDILPSDIYVASEKYVSTLTAPYDYTQVIVLTFYDTNPHHTMKNDNLVHGRVKIGYCYRRHGGIRFEKTRFYQSTCYNKYNKIYYCNGFDRNNSEMRNSFIEHKNWTEHFSVDWCVCFPYILFFTCCTRFCACFLHIQLITLCSNNYVCYAWNFYLVLFLLTV